MALKVGVVGMSGIGNNHANCHANDDLAELVAVCDIMKERADNAAERLGVKAYYSLADMIDGEPTWTSLMSAPVEMKTAVGTMNQQWRLLRRESTCSLRNRSLNDIGQARDMVAKAHGREPLSRL